MHRRAFHKALQNYQHRPPSDFSLTYLFLGAQKILADYQAFGGAHVCTYACTGGTGSLTGMKFIAFILGMLSAIALCICMLCLSFTVVL